MFKKISFCVLFLIFPVFIAIYLAFWYQNCLAYYNPQPIQITIVSGESITDISTKLYEQNLIKSSTAFLVYTYTTNTYQNILPGIHTIPENQDMSSLVRLLTSNPDREISITFPEGYTNDQIISKLSNELDIDPNILVSELSLPKYKSELPIYIDSNNLEGFLFPDTYRFKLNSNPSQYIQKFIDNFNSKWDNTNSNINKNSSLSDYQILILASIIEKEAHDDFERRTISGIFHNRLDQGIPLGANATLNYILQEPKEIFTDYEINFASPYNTYLNLGLPPTPICNPGLESIKAALNPESTDYLYFLHTSDNNIIYSKNYTEHQQNINKYL